MLQIEIFQCDQQVTFLNFLPIHHMNGMCKTIRLRSHNRKRFIVDHDRRRHNRRAWAKIQKPSYDQQRAPHRIGKPDPIGDFGIGAISRVLDQFEKWNSDPQDHTDHRHHQTEPFDEARRRQRETNRDRKEPRHRQHAIGTDSQPTASRFLQLGRLVAEVKPLEFPLQPRPSLR